MLSKSLYYNCVILDFDRSEIFRPEFSDRSILCKIEKESLIVHQVKNKAVLFLNF
jgi:hypothetical protein